jgi:hypothetical protein
LAFEGIDLPPPSEHELFFRRKIHDVVAPVVYESGEKTTINNLSGLASESPRLVFFASVPYCLDPSMHTAFYNHHVRVAMKGEQSMLYII